MHDADLLFQNKLSAMGIFISLIGIDAGGI
jgi:hypothetical protein